MSAAASGPFTTARIAAIILAIGGVAVVAATVSHFRRGPVPVIEADNRPIRERPKDPGGMQIPGANNELLGGDETTNSQLAPAPEAPNPNALRAPPPQPAPAPAPAPVASPAPVAAPVPTPAPAPAAAAVVPPPARPKPPTAPTTTPNAAPAPAHPATPGKAVIQLAALDSEAKAQAEWQTLQKRFPDLLAGHTPSISKIERGGKTFWRLRTAGFPDAEHAKAVCEKVRAKGSACAIADS